MEKVSFIILLVAAVCSAIPLEFQETQEGEYVEAPRGDRHTRATCDLLSASAAGVSLNHSACAAHCLVIGNGYRGDRCIDGICHCRK